jgi:phosphoenolpyruvate-protein kinase (PTS system EI component)
MELTIAAGDSLECTLSEETASPHKELHDLGTAVHAALKRGDEEVAKRRMSDIVDLTERILSILAKLESEYRAA